MGATLAPWPFLVGGAAAVEVALLLEGDVIEQRYLWHGGESEARDGSGILRVRAADDGFELLLHGVRDGVVTVGERAVSLRKLALCGVVALPLGPTTTARLRLGATELRVAGTTAPAKLALAPVRSGRELATLAAGAAAALVCAVGLMATLAAPPRLLDWQLQYRAWMLRLSGGLPYEGTVTKLYAVKAPGPRPAQATAAPKAAVSRPPNASAAAKAKESAAKAKESAATAKESAATAKESAAAAKESAAAAEESAAAAKGSGETKKDGRASNPTADAAASDMSRASAAAEPDAAAASQALAADGARRARATGAVAQLAQWHAGFLGDEHAFGDVEVALSELRLDDSGASVDGNVSGLGRRQRASGGGRGGATNGRQGIGLGGAGAPRSDSGANDSGGASDGGGASGGGASDGDGGGLGATEDGLSLAGSGLGGGGADGDFGASAGAGIEETIGLGTLGTVGHGSGTGTGYGSGSAYGRLGGHTAAVVPDLAGIPTVRGRCDAAMIRRVVRAHVNEVRFCYERALQARPELTGRVVARFDIARDGSAADAAIDSSTVADPTVAACVAGAIRRWQFPTCAATVSYPFVFVPAGD